MNEVLGTTAGNALEVREAVDYLTGARARAAPARGHGRARRRRARAARLATTTRARAGERRWTAAPRPSASAHMVNALGGPGRLRGEPGAAERLRQRPVPPERPGYVDRVDTPRRRPRRHRPRRQPPARGRRDRPRRRPRRRSPRSAPRSARTAPLAIVHARGDASAARGRDRAAAPRSTSAPSEPADRAGAARARMMLPLGELHVHLEGTAPPALIQKLADRNGLKVPEGVFETRGRVQVGRLPRLPAHLRPGGEVIRTEQDYRDITYEYLTAARARARSTSS